MISEAMNTIHVYHGPPDCPRCGAPNCCPTCCKATEEDLIGMTAYATTAATDTTSVVSIDDVLRVMRELREKHPPSTILKSVSMGEQDWRRMQLHFELRDMPRVPRTIMDVPVWVDDGIPDGCYDMEYADGHVDRVTPFGKFKIRAATHA